uniref:Putative secreted protein n=2 Tax=Ixodes ricinus TaxID=34613 RepID=A0A090X9C1_IXORI
MLLRLLLLVLSIGAAISEDMCGPSDCLCTPADGDNNVFMHCANRSLTEIPEFPPEPKAVLGLEAGHNSISQAHCVPKGATQVALIFHYNRIWQFCRRVSFTELNSLEVLDLSHNNIMELQPECFQGLEKLIVLNLTENFVETIQPKTFHEIPLLKQLSLAGNSFKIIDSQWFSNLKHMEHLDLRLLALSSLPEDVFHFLPVLTLLELSGNDFEDVPTEALRGAKSLKILHMEQNPIATLTWKSFFRRYRRPLKRLHLSSMTAPNIP